MPVKFLLSCICLVFLASCSGSSAKAKEKASTTNATPPEIELVRAVAPQIGDLSARLEITARVTALEQTDVLPRVEGLVIEVLAEEGDDVEAGTVLARIEDDKAKIAVDQAAVALEQAELAATVATIAREEAVARLTGTTITRDKSKADLDRALAQFEKKAIAAQDREKAEYDYNTAVSEQNQADIKLRQADEEIAKAALTVKDARIAHRKAELDESWTLLTAAIKGRVTRRHLRLGQKAVIGQPAFSIADLTSLVIEPKIPEKELRVLREGLPVRVESTSYPGLIYKGQVTRIAPEIDVEGGSIRVRIALEPGTPPLRPGMFVSGHIETERREGVVLIPKKALLFDRERPYVFVIDEKGDKKSVRKIYLRRGLQDAEQVEYLPPEGRPAEIDAASRIIVVGLDKLTDGAEVKIEGETEVEAPAKPATADDTNAPQAPKDA